MMTQLSVKCIGLIQSLRSYLMLTLAFNRCTLLKFRTLMQLLRINSCVLQKYQVLNWGHNNAYYILVFVPLVRAESLFLG